MTRWHAWRRTGLGVGLAFAAVAVLLWSVGGRVSAGGATRPLSPSPASARPLPPAWGDDRALGWGYTSPVTKFVSQDDVTRWDEELFSLYNVVITFPAHLFSNDLGAVFTFTPESGYTFTAPMTSLDRFFRLDGEYVYPQGMQAQVSFNWGKWPEIEWHYQDPGDLAGIQESTLKLYWYLGFPGGRFWKVQQGTVDMENNTARFQMESTGVFGFAGYGGQLYLPIVARSPK